MTRPAPEDAAAYRRAAALFTHWRREGSWPDGEIAVLDEIGDSGEEWVRLVCALLYVGCNMAVAARDSGEDEYLASVIRRAGLDEVAT